MRLKWKIIIPTICIIIALIIAVTFFITLRFTGFTLILFQERVSLAASGLQKFITDCEYDTRVAAAGASADDDIINAIANRDHDEIIRLLIDSHYSNHVDFFTVTDETGTVLARTYSGEYYSDSVLDEKSISEALKGNVFSVTEKGKYILVAVRSGAPVYDAAGRLVGVISSGIRLDSNETLDRLKAHYMADFTIFYNYQRIATTIFRNGERIVGIEINEDVKKYLDTHKSEYYSTIDIAGENFSVNYLPLLDEDNEVWAVIAVAYSNQKLIQESRALYRSVIIIGLYGLIFSILMLLYIATRITRPVNRLTGLVSEVTNGNINVQVPERRIADDEIGALTLDIYSLINVIKSILNDLSYLTVDLDKFGSKDIQIDTQKYSGSYRQIIDGIKKLADSISTMRMTMAVLDYLDAMIAVVDFDYNLLYVNSVMVNKYRMDRSASIGQKCYKAIRNLDQPCEFCEMENLRRSGNANPLIEFDNLYEKVSGIYMGGIAAIIRWVDGQQVFFYTLRDVTVKMEYQEQLRKAMHDAETASIAKTAFLANMSHEIRTPMNSIIGFTELAIDSEVTPITREYLNLIKENTVWLLQIINDVLDISKVESGNMELEYIPFDLSELLNSCKNSIQPKTAEKKIGLMFPSEPVIRRKLIGDPTRLRQILLNILSNAVKFTSTGRVILSVTEKDLSEEAVTLQFDVTDTGIGMTSEQIVRISEPFMQADISTTRKYGGTGLGLAIIKSLLDLMGGQLEISSNPGEGTVIGFSLKFPLAEITEPEDEAAITDESEAEIQRPEFRGEVLICEDNNMNQRVITEHLSRVGLNSEIAVNGQEGIDKAAARVKNGLKPYDLILMDIHMPVMDGLDAASKIIELGIKTPIIAMTANIMTDDINLYKSSGMVDYLGKPFTTRELWRCLLKYLKPVGFRASSVNLLAETETGLQKELKVEFVKNNQTRFEEISGTLDEGDIITAHRLTHTLKSNAGLIGMSGLQKASADVEAALKNGVNLATREQMDLLQSELASTLDLLEPYAAVKQEKVQPAAASYTPEKINELLDRLEPFLKSGNPECLKMIDELRVIPDSGELVRQIEDFYFSEAEKTLLGLRQKLAADTAAGSINMADNLLKRRTRLADALNIVVRMFKSLDRGIFREVLANGFSIMADAMDINRIIIFRQVVINGTERFKQIYRWDKEDGGLTDTSFNFLPNTQIIMDWYKTLVNDVCIDLRLSDMSEDQADFVNIFGIKSVLMVPVILYGNFLGFVSFQDHNKERKFDDDCIDLYQSFAHLCANSVIYTEMEREAAEQYEFNRVMFETAPVGIALFDGDLNIYDCNEALLSMFNVTKEYFISHFFELSPEIQPDGTGSREKVADIFMKVIHGERLIGEWMHQKTTGEPIPCKFTAMHTFYSGKEMGLIFLTASL